MAGSGGETRLPVKLLLQGVHLSVRPRDQAHTAFGSETPALEVLTSDYTSLIVFRQNRIYLCWASVQSKHLFFLMKSSVGAAVPGGQVFALGLVFNTATPSCLQLACYPVCSPRES